MLKQFSLVASVCLVMVFAVVGALSAPASAAYYHAPLFIDFDVDDAHGAPDQTETLILSIGHKGRLKLAPDIETGIPVSEPKQTLIDQDAESIPLSIGGDAFRVGRG